MADDRDTVPDQPDDASLARYLSGTCSAAERLRVERWASADPAHRAELERLRAAWEPTLVGETDPDDRMWRWLAERMDEPTPRTRPTLVRPTYRTYPARTWRSGLIAAALMLAIGAGAFVQLNRRAHEAGSAAVGAPAGMRVLATHAGERATGNLPDGSRVILGPDSRIEIPASFAAAPSARGARELHLRGEAFFTVVHDSTRPFRVHTSNGVVEDIGTEFDVTAYPETHTTRVVVASGIVALRNRDAGAAAGRVRRPILLTLERGDLARIDAAGAATLTRNVDVAAYTGWTTGTLAFDGVPMRDALARLSHWYDLDIRLADSALADRRLTAKFHDEPVSRVLRVLEIALDVRAEQAGRVITLRPSDATATRNH